MGTLALKVSRVSVSIGTESCTLTSSRLSIQSLAHNPVISYKPTMRGVTSLCNDNTLQTSKKTFKIVTYSIVTYFTRTHTRAEKVKRHPDFDDYRM